MAATGGLEQVRGVVRVLVMEYEKRDWNCGYMQYF